MKQYNERKICFIINANNKQYLDECLLYMSLLEIPEGFEIELLVIEDAKSMASGYNEGMDASDAKYKIYLRQDTLVVEKQILKKLVEIFGADEEIGIIGTVGCEHLPKDAVIWHGDLCGNLYEAASKGHVEMERFPHGYREVEAVEGGFLATQYDLPWREDRLEGWEFYDVSQCMEFRRAGYRVVVPAQKTAWNIFAGNELEGRYTDKYRRIILEEYRDFFEQKNHLRILFVHSDRIRLAGLLGGFMGLGHEVDEFPMRVDIVNKKPEEVRRLEEALEEGHYDLVVSYDFIASVSDACENMDVKYYAWVYDSPQLELYMKEAKNSVNYISVFDRRQYGRLEKEELAHLKYFPLASEGNLFSCVRITPEDEKRFGADVSFVGRLYEKKGFEELFDNAPQEYREEAEAIVRGDLCEWEGLNPLYGKASEALIAYITGRLDARIFSQYHIDKRYYCESMKLARKRNEYERIAVLNEAAKKFKTVIYTEKTTQQALKNVEIRPYVDYLTVMPKVFYLSKINLNITSGSIESGIPQRVWDILAVGGFCLTNYQPELEEYFEIGRDLEVYHNLEELMEKTRYYLEHEEERIRIGINGYKKVRDFHSYEKRLADVLAWIFDKQR